MLYLERSWDTFDAWCLTRGVDTGALTSRRLVALTLAHLTEGADRERQEKFMADLERIGNDVIEQRHLETPIPDAAPPPGWKSDEENWAGIQAFLGTMRTTKKGVSDAGSAR